VIEGAVELLGDLLDGEGEDVVEYPSEPKTLDDYYFGSDKNDLNSTKFIACEEQWFKTLDDFSVFKALLECPALLAINESGALDLSGWVNNYLLSTGTKVEGGEGVLIGQLKDWNYVEEFVPIQMIQVNILCLRVKILVELLRISRLM